MTTSKKKKSSNLYISCPHASASRARVITLHHKGNRTGSMTTYAKVSATSSQLLGMSPSHPEFDNSLSEYIENQTNIQHDSPAEGNAEGNEEPKQRTRTKVLEDWLEYRDTYLQEMLRHDGQDGLLVTFCADCGKIGDFLCNDCAYTIHYCMDCIVHRHCFMPFHQIRVHQFYLISTSLTCD
jgi:hypothetical protein